MKNASGRADIKNVLAVAEIDTSKTVMKQNGIRAANNRQQINQVLEANKMQRKRRDNRTRMQRKADRRNTIAALCLFSCAVLAFCAGVCKITAPKLKAQEGALKCETDGR